MKPTLATSTELALPAVGYIMRLVEQEKLADKMEGFILGCRAVAERIGETISDESIAELWERKR